jgi:hypothetical protein
MSHEQNMHHHLIYLAATMFNTNETPSGSILLTGMQVKHYLAVLVSCKSGQPPSTVRLLDGFPAIRLTSQRTYFQSRYVYTFPLICPQPSVMSVSYFSSATQSEYVDNTYQAYLSDPENYNTSLQAFVSFDQLLTTFEEQIATPANYLPPPITTSHRVRLLYHAPNA